MGRMIIHGDDAPTTRLEPKAGGVFHVRPFTPRALRQVREAAGLTAYTKRDELLIDEQDAALTIETADYLIAGWSDVAGGDGVDFPCDREHKQKAIDAIPGLLDALLMTGRAWALQLAAGEQVAEGNSPSSSPGEERTDGTAPDVVPTASVTDARIGSVKAS